MQKLLAALLLLGLAACNNNSPKRNFSTVDSNVAGAPDSVPSTLYLDSSRGDSSFSVAMDSAGPTVEPQDTGASNKRRP